MDYGPGIARGIGRGIHNIGEQTGLNQRLQQGLGGGRLESFYNAITGNQPQEMTPEQMAQQNYLQQIQQPFQLGSQQRQQQLMNQFNQQIVPDLKEMFSSLGGQRSSAFGQQLGAAGADLMTNLGALQEQNALQEGQLNQGRLGQLGNYLGGQQQLGLQAQQLGQAGTIAQQENALRRMGLMANYDISGQDARTRQLDSYARMLGNLGNLGMGNRFDTKHYGAQPSGLSQMIGGGRGLLENYLMNRGMH
jgi:hypothetical protein